MSRYWFTADLHLGHKEILDFCNRPFRSIEGMDKALILRWNARVKPEDTVFHIGDFSLSSKSKIKEYLKQLNGIKILIKGSHDKRSGLKTIIESVHIKFGGKRINLVHDPKFVNSLFQLNFCGHIHNKWKFKRKTFAMSSTDIINVGVDVWGFFPVSFNEIMRDYYTWIKGGRK